MPDRKTIAIGAPKSDSLGVDAGLVRVYHLKNGSWKQKGQTLLGDSANGEFGSSLDMPDSNTVIIGAPYYNGPNGSESGLVRVYNWKDSLWVQKGTDFIGGGLMHRLGWSVSMSDSNHLAIGTVRGGMMLNGEVSTYRWGNGSWNLMGNSLVGDTSGQRFGYSISMPDSNTLGVGSQSYDKNGNIKASVFSFTNGQWIQKGSDIIGAFPPSFRDCDIDMYDADHIAIGAPSGAGEVTRLSWGGSQWIKSTSVISALQPNERIGYSVAMPHPDIIGAGSPIYDNDTIPQSGNQGRISVYRFCDSSQFSYGTDSIVACGSFRWIDSITYMADNDTSMFTLSNRIGCDSIVTLNLTIIDIDTSVVVNTPNLTALDSGANYQWFACDSGFVPIPGANQQSFTAVKNGHYAVVLGKNGCADTSSCISITDINTPEHTQPQLKTYPNPVKDLLYISLEGGHFNYRINSPGGTCVYQGQSDHSDLKVSIANLPAGLYMLRVFSDQGQTCTRFYKQP
jgi:hypothetical protein